MMGSRCAEGANAADVTSALLGLTGAGLERLEKGRRKWFGHSALVRVAFRKAWIDGAVDLVPAALDEGRSRSRPLAGLADDARADGRPRHAPGPPAGRRPRRSRRGAQATAHEAAVGIARRQTAAPGAVRAASTGTRSDVAPDGSLAPRHRGPAVPTGRRSRSRRPRRRAAADRAGPREAPALGTGAARACARPSAAQVGGPSAVGAATTHRAGATPSASRACAFAGPLSGDHATFLAHR